jgi:hypothetical protein
LVLVLDAVQENTKDGRLIELYAPPRRTQHRLFISMGIAACLMSIVIASLEVFLDFEMSTPKRNSSQGQSLTVQLRRNDADLRPEHVLGEQADDPQLREDVSVVEISTTLEDATAVIRPESQPDELTATDWRKNITESVVAIGNEKARQEVSRSFMWKRTHSIMFRPNNEQVLREQDPIIPNFRFKPQVHVAGLGITIGSCFIGIPLVGVPVEERTVAVRLFVCAKG